MSWIAMTLVFVLTLGMFARAAVRRWQLLRVGAPEPRFQIRSTDDLFARLERTLWYGLGQKKMPLNSRYRLAGLAHMGIYLAFVVLLLNTIILWVRGYDADFDLFAWLGLPAIVGHVYSLLKELVAFAAIAGGLVFVYLRLVSRPKRMSFGLEGLLILGIIITMMIADYIYVGGHLARLSLRSGTEVEWTIWEPFGSAFAILFSGLSPTAMAVFEHVGFWWHACWVLLFLNLLPYSKHFHVITAIPNVFFDHTQPFGQLPDVDDLEGKVERDEPIGVSRPEHLTWKHILDLYTCTECGRCSDNCPAYTTDKKLSPKHFTLALRDHLYDMEAHYIGSDGIVTPDPAAPKNPPVVHGDPPPDAYFRKDQPVDLIGDVIHPEVIWACTTCRACEEQCPVNISYVDKIVEMRRHEMLIKNEFPAELANAFQAMEINGNPWNLPAMDRGKWAQGLTLAGEPLHVPTIQENPGADVLYWVGCAANYDDQAKKVAQATARLLHHAGVDFAIMGTEATCTGDPARRAGNEYLFQMLAEQNVESLNGAGAAGKKVVTACPHCFNTLANEYPSFGGKYEVVHHTELLRDLIEDGALNPSRRVNAKVAYHDSCYLGRYNEVYDAPREVLESIGGLQLEEAEYWNREQGLCCGAGGAQMWKEEEEGSTRVNEKRTRQLLDTQADIVASGCPFCMTMLSDGIKSAEADNVEQLDVAQVLERAMDWTAAESGGSREEKDVELV